MILFIIIYILQYLLIANCEYIPAIYNNIDVISDEIGYSILHYTYDSYPVNNVCSFSMYMISNRQECSGYINQFPTISLVGGVQSIASSFYTIDNEKYVSLMSFNKSIGLSSVSVIRCDYNFPNTPTSFIFSFNCAEFEVSNVNYTSLYYSQSDNSYKALIYLGNTRQPPSQVPVTCTSTSDTVSYPCTLSNVFSDYYVLNINISSSSTVYKWQVEFLSNILILSSPINNYETKYSQIDILNNSLENYKMFGQFNYPQFTINVNSLKSTLPSPFITLNDGIDIIRPLYSNGCDDIYLGTFMLSNSTNVINVYNKSAIAFTYNYSPIFSYTINSNKVSSYGSSSVIFNYGTSVLFYSTSLNFGISNYSRSPNRYSLGDEYGSVRSIPYGLVNIKNGEAIFTHSIFSTPDKTNYYQSGVEFSSSSSSSTISSTINWLITDPATISIEVSNINIVHFINDMYLVSLSFSTSDIFIYKITFKIGSNIIVINPYKYITSGSLQAGTLDFYINSWEDPGTQIQMNIVSSSAKVISTYLLLPKVFGISSINDPTTSINLYRDISEITFLYSSVNLTHQSIYNTMYIKFNSNTPIQTTQPIKLITKPHFDNVEDFAIYNSSIDSYQITFKMPANIKPGYYPYIISLSKSNYIENIFLNDTQQLNIISNNFDLMGPVIKDIIKFPSSLDGSTSSDFGFQFNIIDNINGFRNGYIVVVADDDYRKYNFTIDLDRRIGGDKYFGQYRISITTNTCVSQVYRIIEIVLFDSQGVNSTFIQNPFNSNGLLVSTNPLMYVSDIRDLMLTLNCPPIPSPESGVLTYPTIEQFIIRDSSLSPITSLLSANSDKSVIYVDAILKLNSGISDITPTLYIADQYNDIIESSYSTLLQMNTTHCIFRHTVNVPYAFGVPNGFSLSYFGIIGLYKQLIGYSHYNLVNLNISQNILSTPPNINYPVVIDSLYPATPFDDTIYLYGRGLSLVKKVSISAPYSYSYQIISPCVIKIVFASIIGEGSIPVVISTITHSFLYSVSVKQIHKQYLNIYESSPYIIKYNDTCGIYEVIETPEPNTPQKCLGNPECGGPSHGSCTISGCVCVSPWFGNDCSSKFVPSNPNINNTSPSTQIDPINANGNFTSLISVYAIRELNIQDIPVRTIYLNSWNRTESSNPNIYHFINVNESRVQVNVDIEYFNNDTTIEFAQQELKMYASSIKYSITISNYQFSSVLNKLELIMVAQLSSFDEGCSAKQFGNTTDDNSNYIKLQVNKNSLYGRLIRRGIIDNNKIIVVSNKVLDKELNSIESSSSAQTYISIQTPHFYSSVVIDPDFGLLVDTKNDNENQICVKSKGLTKSQIIGIVLGVIGASIIIATVITIIKKRKHIKQMKLIKIKLNNMDK